jgi:CCR4-NOT complex subunit CAF16
MLCSCFIPSPGGPRSILPPLQRGQKLLHIVEGWLRQERDQRLQKQQQEATARAASGQPQQQASVVPSRTPMMPNKHLAFFR